MSRDPVQLLLRACLALIGTGGVATTQVLSADPGPHASGAVIPVTATNDTGQSIFYAPGCAFRKVRARTGEYVGLAYIAEGDCQALTAIAPGASAVIGAQLPDAPGTYVIVFPWGPRASTRVSVVQPSPVRKITFYPSNLIVPQDLHEADFADPAKTTWEFTNSGEDDKIMAPGTAVNLLSPGGGAALATLDLSGLVVPPGKVAQIVLPLAGLPPGPYTVEAFYEDSGPVRVRGGIHVPDTEVDLHLPDGLRVASLTGIRVQAAVEGFSDQPGQGPLVLLLICLAPGTLHLPDGSVLPLAHDLAFEQSSSGLGGLFAGSAAWVPNLNAPGSSKGYGGALEGALLFHPGSPSLSGKSLRLAALAVDPGLGMWGVSQAEEILLD